MSRREGKDVEVDNKWRRWAGKPTLEELERFRASLGYIYVTEEELQAAKRESRP
jgi:hypothetical protein